MAKQPAARPASAEAAMALITAALEGLRARTAEHESTAVEMPALADEVAPRDQQRGDAGRQRQPWQSTHDVSPASEGPAPSSLDSLVEAGAQAIPTPGMRAVMEAASLRHPAAERPAPDAPPASPSLTPALTLGSPVEISGMVASLGDGASAASRGAPSADAGPPARTSSSARAANPATASGVRPASGGLADRRLGRPAAWPTGACRAAQSRSWA